MASELKPETLAKKLLAHETLPEFLARMTLVWEQRQRRLAVAPAKAAAAAKSSLERAIARDCEGTRARRREAVQRYETRNREAIRAREARQRARLGAALSVAVAIKRAEKAAQREADKARQLAEKDAKRAKRSEGYPKIQTKPHQGVDPAQVPAVVCQSDLSRAWAGHASGADSRLEKRTSSAANPGSNDAVKLQTQVCRDQWAEAVRDAQGARRPYSHFKCFALE